MKRQTCNTIYLISVLLIEFFTASIAYSDSLTAPFTKPVEDRPLLCQGNEPFPAPERFNQSVADKLRNEFGIEQIVFVERSVFQSSHYYTDFIDGSRFFGTDICVLDLKTGRKRSILPVEMKSGIVNRIDLSFDAKRVVFDWKADNKSGFHIWEIGIDGTGLRQITFAPETDAQAVERYKLYAENLNHWVSHPERYPDYFGVYQRWTDDIHPAYLPDCGIVFASTRCQHGILCDGPDYLNTTVLYRTNAEGKTDSQGHVLLEKLTNSSVSEANPVVAQDGRIIYTRWEYVDKGASCVKCVWSMKQNGTASAEVFGNDHASPPSVVHARPVPNSPQMYVATGAPHCPQTGVGGLIGIDASKNIRFSKSFFPITPETRCIDEGNYNHSWISDVYLDGYPFQHISGPLFADPYPISQNSLICSAMLDTKALFYRPDGYGIYFLEDFNQTRSDWEGKFTQYQPYNAQKYGTPEEYLSRYKPLYRAAGTSCWCAIPVITRPVPPINITELDENIASKKLHGVPVAACLVTDVYVGLENVKRGEAKYIRINEQVPRPWSARRTWGDYPHRNSSVDEFDQQHSPVGATHLGLKVQWGIVPIESDGSAWFLVPADRNVFFQVLDENFQELQRERTYVNYRPGEVRACVGCHETPHNTPKQMTNSNPIALRRPPSVPGPQPGETDGARTLSFAADVQPILDKKCVSCHNGDYVHTDGKRTTLDLRGLTTPHFNVAYENLLGFRCGHDSSYNVLSRPESQSLVGRVIREIYPKVGNAEYLPARTLGSTTSSLMKILDAGHYGVKLTPEERVRIVTWIDSNCQYFGSYIGSKNKRFESLPNYRPEVTFEKAISSQIENP